MNRSSIHLAMYIVCKYNSCEEMFNSFSKLNWWSPNSEQLRWLLRNVVQLSLKFRAGGTCSVRGALPFQMILAITYSKPSSLNDILLLHNGGNDSHKRQFLALGIRSQSWKLDNLSKKILVKLTDVTSCLLQFDRKNFCSNNFSNVGCKVSNLRIKIPDKRGQLALIS